LCNSGVRGITEGLEPEKETGEKRTSEEAGDAFLQHDNAVFNPGLLRFLLQQLH